jgi:TRAP-type C4-dicarboxylate transport system permease small subunit
MTPSMSNHPPRWYGVPVRVVLVTFIGTLLCFALSLFLAILGTVIVSKFRGAHPDLRIPYRLIALPAALAAGAAILVTMLITEVRRYRQVRALSAIERMN